MTQASDFDPAHAVLNTVINALKPLNDDQRRSVLRSVVALFNETEVIPAGMETRIKPSPENAPSPEEFVFSKNTKRDTARIAVLAYYLTVYRNQDTFKTADLEALNQEARGQRFGNIAKSVNNAAQRNGLLAMTGSGFKAITPLGKLIVEALPNDEKVKDILGEYKPRVKRKLRKKDL